MKFQQHLPEPGRCIAWRKYSKCSAGNCVEVNLDGSVVEIRDSKQLSTADGCKIIKLSRSDWKDFLSVLTRTGTGSTGPMQAERTKTGDIVMSSRDISLTFDAEEWSAFLSGVRAGEFDPALVSA